MKIFLFLISSLFLLSFENGIYNLSIDTIDGHVLNLESLKGKKIVVVVFNAARPDTTQLVYLDQLQKKGDAVKIIAMPALDFKDSVNLAGLLRLKIILGPDFIMGKPSKTKKKDKDQNKLLKWLTNQSENKHFDQDVEAEGQMFVVSEKGNLYSIIPRSSPKEMVAKALYRNIPE